MDSNFFQGSNNKIAFNDNNIMDRLLIRKKYLANRRDESGAEVFEQGKVNGHKQSTGIVSFRDRKNQSGRSRGSYF